MNEARKPVDWAYISKTADHILKAGLNPDEVEFYTVGEGTRRFRDGDGNEVTEKIIDFVEVPTSSGNL